MLQNDFFCNLFSGRPTAVRSGVEEADNRAFGKTLKGLNRTPNSLIYKYFTRKSLFFKNFALSL